MPGARFTKLGFRILLLPLVLRILCEAQAPRPEPVTDQETELGHEIYQELTVKGEIIESSPLYETLKPLADAISRTSPASVPASIQVLFGSRIPAKRVCDAGR